VSSSFVVQGSRHTGHSSASAGASFVSALASGFGGELGTATSSTTTFCALRLAERPILGRGGGEGATLTTSSSSGATLSSAFGSSGGVRPCTRACSAVHQMGLPSWRVHRLPSRQPLNVHRVLRVVRKSQRSLSGVAFLLIWGHDVLVMTALPNKESRVTW
jgi:hypothetical protein